MADIMIIDDKSYMSSLISEDLDMCGHSVTCYEEGFTAMEEISANSPDIVLFDLYYRGVESWNILHSIKLKFPEVPVIIYSAYSNFLEDPRVAEADGFVFKSIFTNELKREIERILGKNVHEKRSII